MKKILFLTAAVSIFIFFNYALYKWLQQGHTYNDVWCSITNDWIVAATFFDALIFMTICLVWLCRDMIQRNFTTLQISVLILAFFITGSVTFLVYVAFRKPVPEQQKS